ncbi:MAG: histidine kinase [Pseudomonadota bacterium]
MRKSSRELLGFNDIWLMLIGVPVVSIMTALMMFGHRLETEEGPTIFLTRCSFVSFFYTFIYWMYFRQLMLQFRKWYPNHGDVFKRLLIQGIAVVVSFFAIKFILHSLLGEEINHFFNVDKPHPIALTMSSLTVTFMILGLYESIYFYQKFQASLLEKQKLEKENILSQLESLKNQVNPHFLFNSLNTLTYIIPEDHKLAVRFVQKLSKVYRYILEIRDKKLICLSDELDFLHSYVFLLKERFEDNLHVEVNVPEDHLKSQVVPLSLQILMENAIKHNIISSDRPLHVEVYVDAGEKLVVRNNLQKKTSHNNSTRFGLENIRNRYAFFSDRTVEVIASATSFIVSLPLLTVTEARTSR